MKLHPRTRSIWILPLLLTGCFSEPDRPIDQYSAIAAAYEIARDLEEDYGDREMPGMTSSLALTYAKLEKPEKALEIINTLNYPHYKTNACAHIVHYYLESDRTEQATALMPTCTRYAKEVDTSASLDPASALQTLGQAAMALGDWAYADQLRARLASDMPSYGFWLGMDEVKGARALGEDQRAIEVLKELPPILAPYRDKNAGFYMKSYAEIAREYRLLGDTSTANRIMRDLVDYAVTTERYNYFSNVLLVSDLKRQQQFDLAIELIERDRDRAIEKGDRHYTTFVDAHIADVYALSGRVDEAFNRINVIKLPKVRLSGWLNSADTLNGEARYADAKRFADRAYDEVETLSEQEVSIGDLQKLAKIYAVIQPGAATSSRRKSLLDLAAVRATRAPFSPLDFSQNLRTVELYRDLSETEAADTLLDTLLTRAASAEMSSALDSALVRLARMFIEQGNSEGYQRLLSDFDLSDRTRDRLKDLEFKQQLSSGEINAALKTLKDLPERNKVWALRDTTLYLHEHEHQLDTEGKRLLASIID
ncbi:hypothetical protein GCM10011352_29740 [Marinobacterium zhoushanense]|uniref:Tetratricopeptide repeat protein n=1 Tax=Marinobacterium zhoushanense TaxID=1679163 RepID=A0ABQ1KPZ8_9GAMM|nr:hypothetical protein [Marinobacterium zhoushanense]GGC01654.1 hypothetical protein GCM10011352_29740 [Marinobacterium zhoushanense]